LDAHGKRPGFVLQQAFNAEPGGFVHDSAAVLLPNLHEPHLLRRWPPNALPNPKSALLRTLAGHSGEVFSVSVTPDGRRAVTGSWDNTVRVWDLESGACTAVYFADVPIGASAIFLNQAVIGTATGAVLFVDIRGIEAGPDLKPDLSDEGYEQLLCRGLDFSRREKGPDHAETLAHLTALAVHLEKG